ncbi:hypothetical protein [Marinifilum sp. D714]|uniref:hypothetical protein n=1 Tax=Marinifilum sp. D714 TaxID=2937523 RepID=UPI0027C75DB9|nr:hypothetical protein [Marinifilum sp. D714]MDQ2180787.1 hypothetical protein [Marinifilum sp. D714]
MKTNKFFYGLAIALMMFSCSDSDSPIIEEELQPSNEFEELLAEYNLFNTDVKYEWVEIGLDTNTIYFNGRIKDKLIIKGFNKIDKSSIFSNEAIKLDTVVHIDEGYGKTSTYNITEFSIHTMHKFENSYAFILFGLIPYNQSDLKYALSCDLYVISNQNIKRVKSYSKPNTESFFEKITPWFENSFLILSNNDYNPEEEKWDCYTMDGTKHYEVSKDNIDDYYIPISLEEFIGFVDGFQRRNIKNNEVIWKSENPLSDLPSDIRKDEVVFSQPEDGYVICNIKYTQKDGKRGERTYKVNIASGNFTLIE